MSPLGEILVGATNKGCCFVMFKDSIDFHDFKRRMEMKFKKDIIPGNNNIIDKTEKELTEYFDKKRRNFTVPIDYKGTDFQENVWKELMNIPFGETRVYKDLATKLGKPDAMRAVGNANGNNVISIIVPCHRVIHKNKKKMGYAGGVERKKFLLQLEQN